jgi:hypothetical protein
VDDEAFLTQLLHGQAEVFLKCLTTKVPKIKGSVLRIELSSLGLVYFG